MASNIAETTQSLTTAAEMRETTVMLMQPDANWEEYLTPAPLSIAILGELVFISSGTDFSIIDKNSERKTFKYIKYPESFRACLMQVCNSGWNAFNEAHKSMDRIRLHTSVIPDYIKKSVQIIFNAPDNVIEKLLPSQLENIRSIADDCKNLAENVEKKYLDVINLIGELLEACISAKLFYGTELENAQRNLESLKMREASAKTEKEQAKKLMDAMAKELEEAKETYKKAMNSIPSGWSIIGMNFVEGLTNAVVGRMNGTLSSVIRPKNSEEDVDEASQISACSKSTQILNHANNLSQYVIGNDIDWKNLYDSQKRIIKTQVELNEFIRIRGELDTLSKGKLCVEALAICDLGINICKELGMHTPEKKWEEKETLKLVERIKKLTTDAVRFDTVSKKTLNSPALTPQTPMKHKVEKESSGPKSASQMEIENAHLRIEQSTEQLRYARQLHEKRLENMAAKEKELNDILIEMQNCNVKQIEFDTTIKMLVKGLQAMGEVKEQWNKMVLFFQMVSNIISISLHKTLHNFALTSDEAKVLTYSEKLFTKDLIYTQAFQASNISNLVNMISSTYTQVSNKYLMDRMSSLSRLMTMDPNSPDFLPERLELQTSCKDAQNDIRQLVLKNKADYERMSNNRIAKIEGQLKAILPADEPQQVQKIKEMKEMVQSVYAEDESNYY